MERGSRAKSHLHHRSFLSVKPGEDTVIVPQLPKQTDGFHVLAG